MNFQCVHEKSLISRIFGLLSKKEKKIEKFDFTNFLV